MAYSYYASLTFDHTLVSATEANFPVYVAGTFDGTGGEPDLRSSTNSGNIENVSSSGGASGAMDVPADCVFSTDDAGASPEDFEWVLYNEATGEVGAWVEVTSLSGVSDTVIYICYGDSNVTASQEDVSGTWDANYVGVWHMTETSGTVYDSTSNGNDSTDVSVVDQGAATAKLAGASEFENTPEYIEIGDDASLQLSDPITMEAVAYLHTRSISYATLLLRGDSSGYYYNIYLENSGWAIGCWDGPEYVSSNSTVLLNTWQYYVITIAADETAYLYVDGDDDTNGSQSMSIASQSSKNFYIGAGSDTDSSSWDGLIDEVWLSDTDRDSDYVTTKWNVIDDPSSFTTWGSEQSAGADYTLTAEYGSFTLTGQDVDLDYTELISDLLTLGVG